ncbi:MAG: hypothetical protein WC865_08035 [Bacteroidales bacterium]
MKKFALTICALSIVALSFGQSTIDQSKMQFNAGVGLSYGYYSAFPVYIGADYWINPDITLGLEASFRLGLHHSGFGGTVNANYHFNKILQLPENLDAYAGVSAGPFFFLGDYWANPLHVDFHFQIGGRYKINDKMWVNAEVGGGSFSGGKIGITLMR